MKIIKDQLIQENLLSEESLFHTANGYIGIRGNFEEGYPDNFDTIRGCYINGVYENVPIEYAEKLHGFPSISQRMISIPDIQSTEIIFKDEKFSLFEGEVLSYRRILDMNEGISKREIDYVTNKGKHLKIVFKRMASFSEKHLFLTRIEISSVSFLGNIKLVSKIGKHRRRKSNINDPRVAAKDCGGFKLKINYLKDNVPTAVYKTENSNIFCCISQDHICSKAVKTNFVKTNDGFSTITDFELDKGETIIIDKYTVINDSKRFPNDFASVTNEILKKATKKGSNLLFSEQRTYLSYFWKKCKVSFFENKRLEENLSFALYQLLQCAGNDSYSFIAAKGLSGEGYEGHFFWDTEIYVFPFFLLTDVVKAKSLLLFRYNLLQKAKEHAKSLGHNRGALFPWRTISGSECSGYFPSGSAQYHINSDIAYTYIQYYKYTKDIEFMKKYGLELLYETSLLLLDTGHYDRKGRFCIDEVTGPDEYSCLVDNNYYTNLGAKNTFESTVKIYKDIIKKYKKTEYPIDKNIIKEFSKAAEQMYLPFDENLGIFAQDDKFLDKKKINLQDIPKENFPLLLHYHPLFLYRRQVCKQADTVLAHMIYGKNIDLELQKASFDYYEKITTHDSTLSECIFCIQASKFGYTEKAYNYFLDCCETDLEDKHGNTKDGLHIANLGGAYLTLVLGFAGLHIDDDGIISFNFHPIKYEKGFSFVITKNNSLLKVEIFNNEVNFKVIEGKQLIIRVKEQLLTIKSEITTIEI